MSEAQKEAIIVQGQRPKQGQKESQNQLNQYLF